MIPDYAAVIPEAVMKQRTGTIKRLRSKLCNVKTKRNRYVRVGRGGVRGRRKSMVLGLGCEANVTRGYLLFGR